MKDILSFITRDENTYKKLGSVILVENSAPLIEIQKKNSKAMMCFGLINASICRMKTI